MGKPPEFISEKVARASLLNGLKLYKIEILLFVLVFGSYSYFYNGAAWNHLSRLNTIFSFVEPGTPDYLSFRMNRFITNPRKGVNTGDWSRYNENYYSNKAPGAALIGIPFYFLIYHVESFFDLSPESDCISLINAYLIHLFVTVFPISLSSLFFYRIVNQLQEGSQRRSLFYCFLLYWCTLLFPYGTMLWGHGTATAFLIISLYFFLQSTPRATVYSGFFIGTSVLIEYSCFITVVTYALGILCTKKRKQLFHFLCGGGIPLLVFMAYHKICFGSLFTIANFHINPYYLTDNAVGKLFVGLSLKALWGLTFSPYRGLFSHMPIFLLIFPGIYCFCRKSRLPMLFWVCAINILSYFLLNWSFNGWHGGACIGPRYQIPAFPFYILLLLFLPNYIWVRRASFVLIIPSLFNMLISAAIIPMVRQDITNPLLGFYRGFVKIVTEGQDLMQPYSMPIRLQSPDSPLVKKISAFNWGDFIGLSDPYSLLLWIVGFCTFLIITLISCNNSPIVSKAPVKR